MQLELNLQPLSDDDKIVRNRIICDLMNNKIIQFSQEAANEIVREINTKDKLRDLERQVEWIKKELKITDTSPPPGTTYSVDLLKDGRLPIISTKEDINFKKDLDEAIYSGLGIKEDMNKFLLDDKIQEYLNKIYPAPVMEAPTNPSIVSAVIVDKNHGKISSPSDFNRALRRIGVFDLDVQEIDQLDRYEDWTEQNFNSLRSFIDRAENQKNYQYKRILVSAIKDVIRDINFSKERILQNDNGHQSYLNQLVDFNVFLSMNERDMFWRWKAQDLEALRTMLHNATLNKVFGLSMEQELRDYILKVNRTKKKDNSSFNQYLSSSGNGLRHAKNVKDLVSKLSYLKVIGSDNQTLDYYYNILIKLDLRDFTFLESEIIGVFSSALLYDGLTKDQIDYFTDLLNRFSSNKKEIKSEQTITEKVSEKFINIKDGYGFSPLTAYPLTGFKITQPAISNKEIEDLWNNELYWNKIKVPEYNDSWNGLESLAPPISGPEPETFLKEENDDKVKNITLKADSVNIDSPSIKVNGRNLVTQQDLQVWKDIFSKDINNLKNEKKEEPILVHTYFHKAVDSINNKFLTEAKKAGIRVAAIQLNKITTEVLLSAIPGERTDSLQKFLSSDLGRSFISMINGIVLMYAIKDNEIAQILAKEFRISGMTSAGNLVVEEVLEMVVDIVNSSLKEEVIPTEDEEVLFDWFDEEVSYGEEEKLKSEN